MGAPRITYCDNVHPAEDLEGWFEQTRTFGVPLAAAARSAGRPFGLGAYWTAATAVRLAEDPGARDRLRRFLVAHDLQLWTLNVFPFGGFHEAVVKERVYAPDWSTEERLQFTCCAAEVAASLSRPGAVLPLSTLPLGYRGPGAQPADLGAMARNLARAAQALAVIEERTGVRAVLALEPEPMCLLHTAAEAAAFLEKWLFDESAGTAPVEVLRRHLGVCIDLCHLAVVGEDPLAALADLRDRGIEVPKIQVSSCLELRQPAVALEELLGFDEPRYLHQTVADTGARALDLPVVRARAAEFRAARRVRTHFHLPVHWDREGPLGSTRSEVQRVLAGLGPKPPLLEVETYTWGVLGTEFGSDDLVGGLQAELDFTWDCLVT